MDEGGVREGRMEKELESEVGRDGERRGQGAELQTGAAILESR